MTILQFRFEGYIEVINQKMISLLCSPSLDKRWFWIIIVREETKKEKNKKGSVSFTKMNHQILRPSPSNPVEQDIVLLFFLKHPGTTSTLLHQLMHPRRVTIPEHFEPGPTRWPGPRQARPRTFFKPTKIFLAQARPEMMFLVILHYKMH
jgi:hypothetical protein